MTAKTDNIPMLPGPSDDASQQLTYVFLLRTLYTNPWDDITKIYNRIWHQQDITAITDGDKQEAQLDGTQNSETPTTREELLSRWQSQTTYARTGDTMRRQLEEIQVSINNGNIRSLHGQLRSPIKSWEELQGRFKDWADQAGVELVLCAGVLLGAEFSLLTMAIGG